MKKTLLLFLLLPFVAVASHAQESRQDVSVSVTGIFSPFITGNDVQQSATDGLGGLVSYRYMLTPRSGLELNYQYAQNSQKYYTSFNNVRVHDRMQEFSGAYVLNANFKNWNPFLEGGPAAFMFAPLDDASTTQIDVKGQTILGAMYGAGVAYELSPSWDIRAEYRGLLDEDAKFRSGTAEDRPLLQRLQPNDRCRLPLLATAGIADCRAYGAQQTAESELSGGLT